MRQIKYILIDEASNENRGRNGRHISLPNVGHHYVVNSKGLVSNPVDIRTPVHVIDGKMDPDGYNANSVVVRLGFRISFADVALARHRKRAFSALALRSVHILGEALAAVAKRRVVIVGADAGVETDAVDDGLCVEAFHLSIGVKLVEVADAKSQVGVGKELHGFCLFHSDEKYGNSFGIRSVSDRRTLFTDVL